MKDLSNSVREYKSTYDVPARSQDAGEPKLGSTAIGNRENEDTRSILDGDSKHCGDDIVISVEISGRPKDAECARGTPPPKMPSNPCMGMAPSTGLLPYMNLTNWCTKIMQSLLMRQQSDTMRMIMAQQGNHSAVPLPGDSLPSKPAGGNNGNTVDNTRKPELQPLPNVPKSSTPPLVMNKYNAIMTLFKMGLTDEKGNAVGISKSRLNEMAMAPEGSYKPEQVEAAKYFLANPQDFKALATLKDKSSPDTISVDEFEMYRSDATGWAMQKLTYATYKDDTPATEADNVYIATDDNPLDYKRLQLLADDKTGLVDDTVKNAARLLLDASYDKDLTGLNIKGDTERVFENEKMGQGWKSKEREDKDLAILRKEENESGGSGNSGGSGKQNDAGTSAKTQGTGASTKTESAGAKGNVDATQITTPDNPVERTAKVKNPDDYDDKGMNRDLAFVSLLKLNKGDINQSMLNEIRFSQAKEGGYTQEQINAARFFCNNEDLWISICGDNKVMERQDRNYWFQTMLHKTQATLANATYSDGSYIFTKTNKYSLEKLKELSTGSDDRVYQDVKEAAGVYCELAEIQMKQGFETSTRSPVDGVVWMGNQLYYSEDNSLYEFDGDHMRWLIWSSENGKNEVDKNALNYFGYYTQDAIWKDNPSISLMKRGGVPKQGGDMIAMLENAFWVFTDADIAKKTGRNVFAEGAPFQTLL